MYREILHQIYRRFLLSGGARIGPIESYVDFDSAIAISDDEIGEDISDMYLRIFSEDGRSAIETLRENLFEKMRNLRFDQSDEFIEALGFLQQIVATALWKYHLDVGDSLEVFAREYDRLDSLEERRRLYQSIQLL